MVGFSTWLNWKDVEQGTIDTRNSGRQDGDTAIEPQEKNASKMF